MDTDAKNIEIDKFMQSIDNNEPNFRNEVRLDQSQVNYIRSLEKSHDEFVAAKEKVGRMLNDLNFSVIHTKPKNNDLFIDADTLKFIDKLKHTWSKFT